MDMARIPRFEAPWPVTAHPLAAETEERVLRWAHDLGVIPAYSDEPRMAGMSSGWAAAYTFPPDTSPEHLDIWADCIAIAEVSDDYCSLLTSLGRQDEWAALDVRLRTATRTGRCAPDEDDAMVRATADLSARLLAVAPPEVQNRWADHYDALWDAWLVEASGTYSSVAEYQRVRRAALGAAIVSDILEVVEGIAMPPELYDSEPVTTLADSFGDIMACQNDIASYAIEAVSGEKDNLVAVLMAHEGMTTPQAVQAVMSVMRQRIAEYVGVEDALPDHLARMGVAEADRRGVLRWAEDNRRVINGVTLWYARTARYEQSTTTQGRLIVDGRAG